MTLETFLKRLEMTPRVWALDALGRIRVSGAYCPMEVVFKKPVVLPSDRFIPAGISKPLAVRIMGAADNTGWPDVRARLLRACGLASRPAQRDRQKGRGGG